MPVDPRPNQKHAVIQLQKELTRPKARFKLVNVMRVK